MKREARELLRIAKEIIGMEVSLGESGLDKTWQKEFLATTECCRCGGEARIGFVIHEGMTEEDRAIWPRDFVQFVTDLHKNEGKGGLWLHDCCAVAVYFCRECLEPTALYNQG